jgi:hypothetical protein
MRALLMALARALRAVPADPYDARVTTQVHPRLYADRGQLPRPGSVCSIMLTGLNIENFSYPTYLARWR